MSPILFACVIFSIILIGWAINTANRFVHLEKLMREAWANVDVQLKRRYDLIPNLVATVKAFAAHEQAVLDRVVKARNVAIADPYANGELAKSLNALFIRAEAYPDLRSNANFRELQTELADTEDRIAAARRFYNANVRDFNVMLEQFPSSLMKGNRTSARFFELDNPAERSPVEVTL